MKSESERATAFLESLDERGQILFLARLIYELTLAGRGCDSSAPSETIRANCLRVINELQHRLSARIMDSLSRSPHLWPWSFVCSLFLDQRDRDESLHGEIRRAFVDALAASVR